ncbi:MAG: hypothetical protein DI603_13285 [Roseateles depolymerans]|uniref:Uncharacterized protein n=1 Tax=Roseateles depolymerans TaxID=76731 RepID=A0A2W5FP57_9BURK|nr:MAG: hypothetical protein DI603_13285 [Roseateles depolymerans]
MGEVVTALHRFDLPAAHGLATQRGCQVFLVDPVLHMRAVAAGVAEPLVHTRSTVDVARSAYEQAQVAARSLCADLGERLAPLAPAAAAGAWSSHRIFQLFLTLLGYQRIWPEVLDQHEHERWHVLLPHLAHTYGTHSFVPGLQLLTALRERGIAHSAYGFECPGLDAYQLPDLRRLPADVELLVHLPTCGHDAAYIASELKACGLRVGVLSSQMYDVAFDGLEATGLVDLETVRQLLGPQAVGSVRALEGELKSVLVAHLQAHLGQPRFLDMQVQALWEALEVQALFHLWLDQHFNGRLPGRLLISNHDATVHGALMSFAHHRGLAISVLPHSRVHNLAIKTDGLMPTCLHHALQDGPNYDLSDRLLPGAPLRYPGEWAAPGELGELRVVGLVLNGISANGMCMVDFEAYVQAVRQWLDWARQQGLELRLRVRTAETPVLLMAQRLQLDAEALMQATQGSLSDFARGCDLTLGFDVPTSGLQDLVREGQAAMQIEFRPLARHEWAIVDERIVPRYCCGEAQERLALMQRNPAVFLQFRSQQCEAARARVAAARPLRDWLMPLGT